MCLWNSQDVVGIWLVCVVSIGVGAGGVCAVTDSSCSTVRRAGMPNDREVCHSVQGVRCASYLHPSSHPDNMRSNQLSRVGLSACWWGELQGASAARV